jgi:dCMP deaminase
MNRNKLRHNVYIDMAKSIARLSKDNNTKIGCIIISENNEPVSWGYNGALSGIDDDVIPHSREPKKVTYRRNSEIITQDVNKYPFMFHAESNAIHFANKDKLKNATLYVTGYPCSECAKLIVRSGIKRVVIHQSDVEPNSTVMEINHISELILSQNNIELIVNDEIIYLSLIS